MAVSTVHGPVAALAWADRLYHSVAPLPHDAPGFAIHEALEAYRQVERRYPSRAAREGIANCLSFGGDYRDAERTYERLAKRREARQRAEVAEKIAPLVQDRKVLQVEPVPGTGNRWIAVAAHIEANDGAYGNGWSARPLSHLTLAQYRIQDGRARRIGGEQSIQKDDFDLTSVHLYMIRLTPQGAPVAVAYAGFGAADCVPNGQWIFRIRPDGLHLMRRFFGLYPTEIYPANSRSGLTLAVTPTFKVWWTDAYEWRSHGFAFANRRHPALFRMWLAERVKSYGRLYYPTWMNVGALSGIHWRWKDALKAWKRAEKYCRLCVRDAGEAYRDFGFYGDPYENLKEIRRRIRWIRSGDLNHMLLYRPCDFDLEVPPYELGKSRQEG